MRKSLLIIAVALMVFSNSAFCATSNDILNQVKSAETGLADFTANMDITRANKNNVAAMGSGYDEILRLQKAIISYKRPDLIRYDGFAQGIKASLVQNGYKRLVLAAMIRKLDNLKDAPGKRQDTLDLGFLSSSLWRDNSVTVVSNGKKALKLKFNPKFGGRDKRHDDVWVDPMTLKMLKREKFLGDGQMRVRMTYGSYQNLTGKLSIATTSTLYDPSGGMLGSVKYKNLKVNSGVRDSIFSMAQR